MKNISSIFDTVCQDGFCKKGYCPGVGCVSDIWFDFMSEGHTPSEAEEKEAIRNVFMLHKKEKIYPCLDMFDNENDFFEFVEKCGGALKTAKKPTTIRKIFFSYRKDNNSK